MYLKQVMSDLVKGLGFAGDMARMIADESYRPQMLDNRTRDCAAEAVRQMLEQATERVCIYCHCLANDIYDRDIVVKALQDAFERNASLEFTLFVRDEYPTFNRFLITLLRNRAKIARNMAQKIARQRQEQSDIEFCDIPDFFFVDDKYARVEVSEKDRTAKVYKNNESIKRKINKHVDYLLQLARA